MTNTTTPVKVFPQFKRRSFGFLLISTAFSMLIVTSLIWCMQYLIKVYDDVQPERSDHRVQDYIQSRPNPPEPPPEDSRPKPPPQIIQPAMLTSKWPTAKGTGPAIFIPTQLRGPNPVVDLGAGSMVPDTEYMRLVNAQPNYPMKALERDIEGYCVVAYTISKNGSTKDVTIDKTQCTSTYFYTASERAAERFKYRPRIVDGEPVEVHSVRNKFTFKIDR